MGKTKIPFLNLASSYKKLKPEINLAIKKVLEKGVYISGNEVRNFEKKYAKFCDARYCVGVSSGLDALTLSLKALNIGIGDEVIVPSHTYVATWFAVSNVGAVPVPVEVNEKTYNIDIKLINHLSDDVIINFDYEQFNRLFFNLIKNSVESIQEKAQKVSKNSKNIDIEIRQRRDYININLTDTGIGFKNKKTKDLIKPYFTTKEKGTGLGLSIVDKIISDHNGSIKFLNHKNGAKIQIILPIK